MIYERSGYHFMIEAEGFPDEADGQKAEQYLKDWLENLSFEEVQDFYEEYVSWNDTGYVGPMLTRVWVAENDAIDYATAGYEDYCDGYVSVWPIIGEER